MPHRDSTRGRRRNDNRRRDFHREQYRPQERDSYRRPPSPPRGRFEGNSWRPSDDRRNGAPQFGDFGGGDSYRPRPPQGDFTFRMDQPSGAPASFPPVNDYQRGGRDGRRGGRPLRPGDRPRRGQPGRRWQPVHPSQRALLSGAALNLPEERLNDDAEPAKFRDLEELSDDDELEMDISSRSSDSETEEPSAKRTRTDVDAEAANTAPKWSNPDPYTAMPCPDDTTQKKKDVLKLIRKARVEEAERKPASTSQAEDFLSFDLSSDEESQPPVQQQASAPATPSAPAANANLPPKPPVPQANGQAPPEAPRQPANANTNAKKSQDDPLGSRKRTADDEIKPPDYGKLKKFSMKPAKGAVLPFWQTKTNEEPCPWATVDHSETVDMAFRLHKEVMDFYEYVRPRDFEQGIRDHLVDNLRKAMRRDGRNFASASVLPFGSFMSGLYLPTADMDVVVCSASFMRGGPPTYLGAKSWLYKFQKFLTTQRVADAETIEVIAHARVPLVKFVDKLTGLRVDVSFENLGGVSAVDTFLQWKKQYPAMPILVTIIKHYLLMRGLNEPVNGGIGGFSVICLVVSMLQLMPQVQSWSLIPEHHLGEMLLEFFDLYGRQFQHETNAISLTNPVGYMRKNKVRSFTYKNKDRLSIIDPNNPANDISGGSSNTPAILARFGDAYVVLRDRMKEVASNPTAGGILDVLLKGDYSTFRMQREFLKHVHDQVFPPSA